MKQNYDRSGIVSKALKF